jgi:EmrB/QacA subfamily drug resistance transporter
MRSVTTGPTTPGEQSERTDGPAGIAFGWSFTLGGQPGALMRVRRGGVSEMLVQTEPPELSDRAKKIVFGTILLGMLISALDQTIVSTSLPSIVGDLGGAGHVSWVVTAYLLAETVVTIVAGRLGDLFGRKTVFQVSVAVFVFGSIMSGVAQNLDWLVGARAIQGLGGGGLTVTATALIGDVIPLRERGKYQGALGAVFGVTTVLGPLLGGFFTDDLSWRWDFYVNVPIGLIVVVLAAKTLPTVRSVVRPILDYAGVIFVAIGASGLILATSWGGTTYAWTSPTIIGLFVAALVSLSIFVRVEMRAAQPILPMRLFRSQVFTVCCALSFLVGFAMLGSITFMPTFLQYVDGVSATASGIRMLPLVAGLMFTALLSGVLVSKTGRYKIFPVIGMPIMAVGFFLLSTLDEHSSVLVTSLTMVLVGLGIGLSMQVLTLVVQSTASYQDLGVSTSGVTFFRTMGSAFGTAVFGSLYANFLATRLVSALRASPAVPPAATSSPHALHQLPASTITHVVHAYASSLDKVFIWAVPVAVLGLLLALALKQVPLRGTERASATDLGEAFAMPQSQDSQQRLERAVASLLRRDRGQSVATIVARSGTELGEAELWALLQVVIRRRASTGNETSVAEIAAAHRMPAAVLDPLYERLVVDGLLIQDGAALALGGVGQAQLRLFTAALKQWLIEQLHDWDTELATDDISAALDRIVTRVIQDEAGRRQELQPA